MQSKCSELKEVEQFHNFPLILCVTHHLADTVGRYKAKEFLELGGPSWTIQDLETQPILHLHGPHALIRGEDSTGSGLSNVYQEVDPSQLI